MIPFFDHSQGSLKSKPQRTKKNDHSSFLTSRNQAWPAFLEISPSKSKVCLPKTKLHLSLELIQTFKRQKTEKV